MTKETIHVHMADEFRVLSIRDQSEWAVLQIRCEETGELFRFGVRVDHLDGLGKQLRKDAQLLANGDNVTSRQ